MGEWEGSEGDERKASNTIRDSLNLSSTTFIIVFCDIIASLVIFQIDCLGSLDTCSSRSGRDGGGRKGWSGEGGREGATYPHTHAHSHPFVLHPKPTVNSHLRLRLRREDLGSTIPATGHPRPRLWVLLEIKKKHLRSFKSLEKFVGFRSQKGLYLNNVFPRVLDWFLRISFFLFLSFFLQCLLKDRRVDFWSFDIYCSWCQRELLCYIARRIGRSVKGGGKRRISWRSKRTIA